MRNKQQTRDRLLYQGIDLLREKMPVGWQVKIDSPTSVLSQEALRLRIVAPTGRWTRVILTARQRIDPRGVLELAHALTISRAVPLPSAPASDAAASGPGPEEGRTAGRGMAEAPELEAVTEVPTLLLLSRYLTQPVRERLRELGFAYLDLTGHRFLALPDPGFLLETSGATRAPDRIDRPSRSLRGPRAGRVVRALCDYMGPVGVRALAVRAGVDPGYVSRVCAHLDREMLVERGRRGRIERVRAETLLHKWASDAPLSARGARRGFVDPGGIPALLARLMRAEVRYAVTHSAAAWLYLSHGTTRPTSGEPVGPGESPPALIEPPRRAVLYVESLREVPSVLGLRPVEAEANVFLIDPRDDCVFERSGRVGGVALAAPTQVAADLLGSGGRGPAEAEVLMKWMNENESCWRT